MEGAEIVTELIPDTRGQFRKELFNLKSFCSSKQSRIRKPVPFIYSQKAA